MSLRIRSHYSISAGEGMAYCYIRKNACSAFKALITTTSAAGYHRKRHPDEMAFLEKFHALRRLDELTALPRRVVVLRDPFERIISAWLNRFLLKQQRARQVLKERYGLKGGRPDDAFADLLSTLCDKAASRITFDDFVFAYIAETPFAEMDRHVWPQAAHVAPVLYTDVLFQKTLFADAARLFGPDIAEACFATPKNATRTYAARLGVSVVDEPAAELLHRFEETGHLPAKDDFRSEQVDACLRERYAMDYELLSWVQQDAESGRCFLDMRERACPPFTLHG